MIDSFNYSELLSHSTLFPKSLKIDFPFELHSTSRSPDSQRVLRIEPQGHLLVGRLHVALVEITGSRTSSWFSGGLCFLFHNDIGHMIVTAQKTSRGLG